MADGLSSKNLKLFYGDTAPTLGVLSSPTEVYNVIEMPDLGGDSDSIEITTLADDAHLFIPGLKDYGDSLDFTVLYTPEGFKALEAIAKAETKKYWQVKVPDKHTVSSVEKVSVFNFSGKCTVKFNGRTYNEALQYTLSIKPDSPITYAEIAAN